MILVGAATALGFIHAEFPSWSKTALQIVVGSFLGYSVDRAALACMRPMVKPIALATAWLISSALLIGIVMARVANTDLMTGFLATSPGGLAEMSAMAMTSGANVALVATLQSFRIIVTTSAIPVLAKGMTVERNGSTMVPRVVTLPSYPALISNTRPYGWLMWPLVGLIGAIVFGWLNVPAAGVIGSMLAVAGVRIAGAHAERPPIWLRTSAQLGLGVLIGVTMDGRTVQLLREQFLLVLLVTTATVLSGLALAGFVGRVLRIDPQTALLACAPGGVTQMGIVADELGAEVFVVNMFQLARLICAVLILPLLFHFFV